MAKSGITNIATSQTFQNWFDKTNELVDLFKNETMTASTGSGDTTNGNATLVGNFTATNLTATTSVQSDLISSRTASADVGFDVPITITAATDQRCATFSYSSGGGQTRYTDGTVGWDVGIQDSTNRKFIIDTGTGTTKFELTTGGTLTVPNIITTEAVEITTDLDVNGDARFQGTVNFNGNLSMLNADITANNVYALGEVVTDYSTSDIALKQDIERIENPLEKVKALGGYTFEYKDKPGERATGVIAQEVEMVLPGLVYTADHPTRGEHKAVRYGQIVALLIEAVKELQDEVQRLKNATPD